MITASCMPTSVTHLPLWAEWARALGLPALALAVSWMTWRTARWQVDIAKEKLRHDLYDRRFAIYMAYHELLVAILEKTEHAKELTKATAAKAQCRFLLKNREIEVYLNELDREAFSISKKIEVLNQSPTPLPPQEQIKQWNEIGPARKRLFDRIHQLAEMFEEDLRLQDFSTSDRRLLGFRRAKPGLAARE